MILTTKCAEELMLGSLQPTKAQLEVATIRRESHNNRGTANMEAAEAAQQKEAKKETPTEIWKRILDQKEGKPVKSGKTAAKKSFKKKQIKKMTAHCPRKQSQTTI
jgi:hypothetical protein